MSRKNDRIDELIAICDSGETVFGDFVNPSEPIIDTCKDILLTCIGDCVDISCDCCGDIETTNTDETCVRIITGTDSNNWMQLPGFWDDSLATTNLNSISRNRIFNNLKALFEKERINVNVRVDFEDDCFLITIDFLDDQSTACFRTETGSIVQFI